MDDSTVQEQVDLIRQVFGYISRFRGKVFVVKIAEPVISHSLFALMVKDLSLLRRMGARIVIVPGARQRIDEVLSRYGLTWRTVNGIRVSTP